MIVDVWSLFFGPSWELKIASEGARVEITRNHDHTCEWKRPVSRSKSVKAQLEPKGKVGTGLL